MKTLLRISTLLMTLLILTGGHNLLAQSQEYTMDGMTVWNG
ncbi:hypothetical protein [Rhodohalobacter sp.]|nr:hypothetical protein [Rhodohalobacter sp.]MDZ7757261.1 hypothetical protein [Rhodohalobacter sp.]